MKAQECPKCDEIVRPSWHIGYITDSKTKEKSKIKMFCKESDAVKCEGEHLHYYCKCGYDFIKPIHEGKEDKIIET